MSKILVKDLMSIMRIMKDYESKLILYKKYTPIQKLLNNLVENKKYIAYHLEKQQRILKNKGQMVEENEKKLLTK